MSADRAPERVALRRRATALGRIRTPLHRSFDRALVGIAVSGGLLITLLALLLPAAGQLGTILRLFPLASLVYLVAGLLAWRHRPSSSMGMLILFAGASMYLVGVGNIDIGEASSVGTAALSEIVATVPLAALVHLLLAFPSGRLRGRWPRSVVWAAYATALILQVPLYIFGTTTALSVWPNAELAQTGAVLQSTVGGAVMTATGALLVIRLLRATSVERRVLLPLYGYGVLAIALILAASRVPFFSGDRAAIGVFQVVVLALIPIAFALGVLHGGVARTGQIEEIGAWLGAAGEERPAIAEVLSRALGDPSLEIWFRAARTGQYVDVHGVDVDTADTDVRRRIEPVELEGRLIGAVVYDRALIPDAELVRTAARVAAIALDRERLAVDLRASRLALQQSRERLIEAADAERRRIAQDLHDGIQVRLVLLGIAAQQLVKPSASEASVAERAVELRKGIDDAAADLRDLVHEVMPAALLQRGLSAATEDLADRMPVATHVHLGVADGELSAVVESTAYFVVAEALANAVKHAGASEVRVRLEKTGGNLRIEIQDDGRGGAVPGAGSGLTGMADRVDVLGGSLGITSVAERGTKIEVELPCVS